MARNTRWRENSFSALNDDGVGVGARRTLMALALRITRALPFAAHPTYALPTIRGHMPCASVGQPGARAARASRGGQLCSHDGVVHRAPRYLQSYPLRLQAAACSQGQLSPATKCSAAMRLQDHG